MKKSRQMFKSTKNGRRIMNAVFPRHTQKSSRFYLFLRFHILDQDHLSFLFLSFFFFFDFFGFWKLGGRGVFDDNKRLNGPARRMMIRGKTERKTIIKVAMSISSFPIYYLAFYRHLNVSFFIFIFISDHFLS